MHPNTRWLTLFLAACLVAGLTARGAGSTGDLLNREERQWLRQHPVIRLAYEPKYAPMSFVDAQGQTRGISVEYIGLLEKKLGIRFQIVGPHDLESNLHMARAGEVDVLTSLMQTPERSGYLLFTRPYLIVPAIIIVRKELKGPLALAQMHDMRIGAVEGYAVQAYLQSHFPALDLVPGRNEQTCLQMLSFGETDAAVMDMASASYLIQTKGVSNLRVAGETDFTYDLSLASRKDWPLLNRILEKGLAAITTRESDAIKRNWIHLDRDPMISRPVWIAVLSSMALVIIAIIGVMLWNRSLSRMVDKRSQELIDELAQRRLIEQALREANDYLENLLNSANGPIIVWDPQFRITRFNHAFEVLTGRSETEVLGQSPSLLFPPSLVEPSMALIRSTLTGQRWNTLDLKIQHRDGSVRTLVWNSATLLEYDGRSPRATIAQGQDVTERRRAEEAIKKTLAEKETLIRELYHRTKNNMQIVSSLMNLKAREAGPETRAFVMEMNNQIQGLAMIHQMLHQSGDLSTLDLTQYLDSLTKLVVQNFWSRHHPSMTVNFTGEPLPVTLDVASPCGLVINELLSNTYKHAFPDHREGVITIQVRRDGPQHIVLEYADNGVGLPPGFDPRQQQTLGFQSIFAIVEQQLSGEVRIIPDHGLGFVLRIATGNYQERV